MWVGVVSLLIFICTGYVFISFENFERFGNGKLVKRKMSDITIHLRVVVPPESVYQGVQDGDDEDKCKQLNVD